VWCEQHETVRSRNSGDEFRNSGDEFRNSGDEFRNSGGEFRNSGGEFRNSGGEFRTTDTQHLPSPCHAFSHLRCTLSFGIHLLFPLTPSPLTAAARM
jgi:hypothetical protein